MDIFNVLFDSFQNFDRVNMPPYKGNSVKRASIHWFRHGLRMHDNPALIQALKNGKEFYPIFIFDGEVAGMLLNLKTI